MFTLERWFPFDGYNDDTFAGVIRGLQANLSEAVVKHTPITSQHLPHENPNLGKPSYLAWAPATAPPDLTSFRQFDPL